MSYRVGIDVGGTFTDLALIDESTGDIRVAKVPTTPHDPISGVTAVLEQGDVESTAVTELVHGTTVATNALLERTRLLPGLITTDGFRDVVFIQRMNRKHHYDLQWDKPRPYVERCNCYDVRERVNSQGEIIVPLDEDSVRVVVRKLRESGIIDIAVAFLFSYLNPTHELRVREIVSKEFPEASISLSHEVYPRWREYDRTSTTLADAYLKSLVREYLANLGEGLERLGIPQPFLIMKSNGGVEDYRAASARPVDLIISGPVGGVLSAVHFGDVVGRRNLITMDMGGTSFDVSLIANGRPRYVTEFEIEWGLPVYTPMVDVRTIGAGGGSVAWIDKGGLLRVGPESAGAEPGPACYGQGGKRATVTDANLVLGRINPDYFLGGAVSLDVGASEAALEDLAKPLDMTTETVAAAIVELIDFSMMDAIRVVSIDRGLDPRDFTLVSFGGAGSLHATALAAIIGIEEVLVPMHQGVFSALGLITADMRVDESVTASFRSDVLTADDVERVVTRLCAQALTRIREEGYDAEPQVEESVEARYRGQNYSIDISLDRAGHVSQGELEKLYERFHAEHRRLYGYDIQDETVELVNFKVAAIGRRTAPHLRRLRRRKKPSAAGRRDVFYRRNGWISTPIFDRESLAPGTSIEGPVVIEETMATTLVHSGQSLQVDDYGNMIIAIPRSTEFVAR